MGNRGSEAVSEEKNLRELCPNAQEVAWDGRELDWVGSKDRPYLRGIGLKYLINRYFEEGWRKLLREYRPVKRYRLGLIIPCSYGKPYSQSFIHYMIRSAIADYILAEDLHEIIVTNAGVVPRELDEHWPYCAYDWNPKYETQELRECYTLVLAERLKGYLREHGKWYESLAAYLRWDSDSWKAVQQVAEALGTEIPNLAPKRVPDDELTQVSLNGLYEDPDLVLITPTAIKSLREGVSRILR